MRHLSGRLRTAASLASALAAHGDAFTTVQGTVAAGAAALPGVPVGFSSGGKENVPTLDGRWIDSILATIAPHAHFTR